MNSANTGRIIAGILTLPISGLLFALGQLVPGIDINPSVDPAGFAQAATTTAFLLANLAGLVGLVLLLLGFQALYTFLSNTPVYRWAFVGMVLSIAGIGLFLPLFGSVTFTGPVAARLYLSGDKGALNSIAEAASSSSLPTLIFGGTAALTYILGSIVFGVAMWRCGRLSKWTPVFYAASAPLLTAPLYVFATVPLYIAVTAFLGSAFLVLSGLGIAMSMGKTVSRENER